MQDQGQVVRGLGDLMAGKPYKPDYISRKLFDKYQDRIDLRLTRIKEDYRNDLATVLATVQEMQDQLTELFPIEDYEDDETLPQDPPSRRGRPGRRPSTEGL